MPEPGGDQHQGAVAVWEGSDHSSAASDLADNPLERIIGSDLSPVIAREEKVGKRLHSVIVYQLRRSRQVSAEHKAAAKVLKELVEHHIREEDNNVWDDAKDNFSTDERQQMNVA